MYYNCKKYLGYYFIVILNKNNIIFSKIIKLGKFDNQIFFNLYIFH